MYFGPVRKVLDFLRENRRTMHYGRNTVGVKSRLLIEHFMEFVSADQESERSRRSFSTRSMSAGTSTLMAS
jgi:hypothetical protein